MEVGAHHPDASMTNIITTGTETKAESTIVAVTEAEPVEKTTLMMDHKLLKEAAITQEVVAAAVVVQEATSREEAAKGTSP